MTGMNGSGSQAAAGQPIPAGHFRSDEFKNDGVDSENDEDDDEDRLSQKSGDSQDTDAGGVDGQRDRSGSIDDETSDHSSRQSWHFDMACNFCDKVFSSSTDLENHLSHSCGPSTRNNTSNNKSGGGTEGHKSGSPPTGGIKISSK